MGVKVSVVTVTWNCADTLGDCLESVVRQSLGISSSGSQVVV
jgi:glycosyltransferase involved in cell wall biosynthesis